MRTREQPDERPRRRPDPAGRQAGVAGRPRRPLRPDPEGAGLGRGRDDLRGASGQAPHDHRHDQRQARGQAAREREQSARDALADRRARPRAVHGLRGPERLWRPHDVALAALPDRHALSDFGRLGARRLLRAARLGRGLPSALRDRLQLERPDPRLRRDRGAPLRHEHGAHHLERAAPGSPRLGPHDQLRLLHDVHRRGREGEEQGRRGEHDPVVPGDGGQDVGERCARLRAEDAHRDAYAQLRGGHRRRERKRLPDRVRDASPLGRDGHQRHYDLDRHRDEVPHRGGGQRPDRQQRERLLPRYGDRERHVPDPGRLPVGLRSAVDRS